MFGFVASAIGFASGSGTVLDASTSLDLRAGDLVIAVCAWEDNISSVTIAATSGDPETMTMLAVADEYAGYRVEMQFGYKLVAVGNPTATFEATWSTAAPYREILVLQFRLSEGKRAAFDTGPSPAGAATGLAFQSGNINTSDVVQLIVGATKNFNGITFSNERFDDGASYLADGRVVETVNTTLEAWFRNFSKAKSSINARSTGSDGSYPWVADVVAFKAGEEVAIDCSLVGGQPVLYLKSIGI